MTIIQKTGLVQARTIEGPEAEALKLRRFPICTSIRLPTQPFFRRLDLYVSPSKSKVLVGPVPSGTTFQMTYLVRFLGFPPVLQHRWCGFEGRFTRPGTVQISSLPSVRATNSVPSWEVRNDGHAVSSAHVLQPASTSVFDGLSRTLVSLGV